MHSKADLLRSIIGSINANTPDLKIVTVAVKHYGLLMDIERGSGGSDGISIHDHVGDFINTAFDLASKGEVMLAYFEDLLHIYLDPVIK